MTIELKCTRCSRPITDDENDGCKYATALDLQTQLTTALEKVKQYEEMFAMVDMADFVDGNELWQLSGQWMHGLGPKVFDSPLEAFAALKEQRNPEEE